MLLTFPFTDALRSPRRPALVLLDTGDNDLVAARITSRPPRDDYDVEISEWRQAGLLLPSVARLDKVATLDKRRVERRLGMLTDIDMTSVANVLRQIWSPD